MNTNYFTELLKLKNCFYRHPKCRSAFSKLFLFCVNKAQDLGADIEEMQNLATDAELALQVYSEKAWLWEKDVALIEQYRQSLNNLYKQIDSLSLMKQKEYEREQQKILEEEAKEREMKQREYELQQQKVLEEENKERECKNELILKRIGELKQRVMLVKNFEELNKCITELEELETALDKESFTPKQSELYRSLSSAYTEITSEKMQKFQREADVKYNEEVAKICKKSFDEFKENTKKYKKVDNNFRIAFRDFYLIDSSRLFVDTQMLYSHVYSYIFSKLSDDEKFNLVSFALNIKK